MEPPADTPTPTADASARREWRALARLRDRVGAAVEEIERLRAENKALAERVAELEDRPATGLGFDEDPEVLKKKVRRFLDAVDRAIEASGERPDTARGASDARS